MLILDMPIPRACDDCPMLDESGDYPMCRISEETRGYNFNTREKRMDRCPIKGEIIQCKDCKFWDRTNMVKDIGFPDLARCLRGHEDYSDEFWFCADGERRTDE